MWPNRKLHRILAEIDDSRAKNDAKRLPSVGDHQHSLEERCWYDVTPPDRVVLIPSDYPLVAPESIVRIPREAFRR